MVPLRACKESFLGRNLEIEKIVRIIFLGHWQCLFEQFQFKIFRLNEVLVEQALEFQA